MLLDFLDAGCSRESRYLFVAAVVVAPGMVDVGDLGNVLAIENSQTAGLHAAKLACINEHHFALALAMPVAVAVLGDEPQANWDPRVEEEPVWHSDDAVDEVGFDETATDVALAAAL